MCRRLRVVVVSALFAAGVLAHGEAVAQPVSPSTSWLAFESPSHDLRLPDQQMAVLGYRIEWWRAETGEWLGSADVPLDRVTRDSERDLSIPLADLPLPADEAVTLTLVARGTIADSPRSGSSGPVAFSASASELGAGSSAAPVTASSPPGSVRLPFGGTTADGMAFEAFTIVDGLDGPSALASLPDGRLLVAEAGGRVRQVVDGELQAQPMLTWHGVTIHGLVADPAFETTRWIYLAATSTDGREASTVVIRVREVAGRLSEPAVVLSDLPGGPDLSGALRLGPDGNLYLGASDRPWGSAAQDLGDAAGKILRFTRDGRTATGAAGFGYVHAWGFSDARVFAWDTTTGALWQMERSADGLTTDVNRVEPRGNYGWAGGGPQGAAPLAAVFQWTPGSQPLAAVVYDGTALAKLRGDLLVIVPDRPGLLRVPAAQLAAPTGAIEAWLQDAGMLRHLVVGSDGALYVVADDVMARTSRLIRVVPGGPSRGRLVEGGRRETP